MAQTLMLAMAMVMAKTTTEMKLFRDKSVQTNRLYANTGTKNIQMHLYAEYTHTCVFVCASDRINIG